MWTCNVCGTQHNWMNNVCNHCSAFKITTEMEWMCGDCKKDNDLEEDHCLSCQRTRRWKYAGNFNWECIFCYNHNSFNDINCRKCKIGRSGFIPLIAKKIDQCYLEQFTDRMDVNPLCPICDTMVQTTDQVSDLPCGHVFHIQCVLTWINSDNENALKCPTCRCLIPVNFITVLCKDADTHSEPDSCGDIDSASEPSSYSELWNDSDS